MFAAAHTNFRCGAGDVDGARPPPLQVLHAVHGEAVRRHGLIPRAAVPGRGRLSGRRRVAADRPLLPHALPSHSRGGLRLSEGGAGRVRERRHAGWVPGTRGQPGGVDIPLAGGPGLYIYIYKFSFCIVFLLTRTCT